MSIAKHLRIITKTKEQTLETAEVTDVDGTTAKVKRAGQTNSTKYLPVASGVTVIVGDVVQLVKYNGNINTALITGKVR